MAEDESEVDQPSIGFGLYYAPTEAEERARLLELAGDNPRRQAAFLYWYGRDEISMFDRSGEHLDGLQFENLKVERADIEPIQLFPELQELTFSSSPMTSELLRLIAGHPNLSSLWYFGDPDMGNAICVMAASLPKLQVLSIEGKNIDDEGIRQLAKLTELRLLSVFSAKITAAGLRPIISMKRLSTLGVGNCQLIDDECMKLVAELHQLKSLGLGGTRVTDDGIAQLRSLSKLHLVGLDNTAITDRSVILLAESADLDSVTLDNTAITNAAIHALHQKPRLYRLHIANTAVDDGAVPYLETMTKLRELDVRGTKVSQDGVERIETALKRRIKSDYKTAVSR